MAAAGVIEPSSSPWAAPAILVRKKDGSWRFCVEYRRLNQVTRKDSYPLPRIDDALDSIAGSCWFSSLDLRSGYWQIELAPEARPKTAFTIGQGLWQFRVLHFGLCNGPANFERLMERVLAGIPRTCCVIYLDDIMCHATDFTGAIGHLEKVFDAIRGAGLKLHPKKCHLFRRQTGFLGHVVGAAGVATDPAKVETVRRWPVPRDGAELRSFLGLASYYRRFIRDFATVASPLHRLTHKGQLFEWTRECDAAFRRLQRALYEAPVLAFPDPRLPFILDTDASDVGVGAVLSQAGEQGEQVVAYFSRSLDRAEKNYCMTRRELLAVVAVRHFRTYLYGKRFLLRTDHASLTLLLNFKEPEGQMARWLEALQDYDMEIRHRAGRLHGNADALSRRPCAADQCQHCHRREERSLAVAQPEPAPRQQHASERLNARQRRAIKRATARQLHASERVNARQQHPEVVSPPSVTSYSDRETGDNAPQPHATTQHCRVAAGATDAQSPVDVMSREEIWKAQSEDATLGRVWSWIEAAKKGPTRRWHALLQQYAVGAPMERVAVDVMGPLPVTEWGNRYVLVAMDYFTKWPEAYAVPDQSAHTTADRLVTEMFCRFGAPEELHSDQGRNFKAEVFERERHLCIHKATGWSNERFESALLRVARHLHLPLVLWAYRTAVQESTKCTPAALMFGQELRTPVDLVFGSPPEAEIGGKPGLEYYKQLRERLKGVHELARQAMSEAGICQKRAYDTRCRGQEFQTGDKVWVYCPERRKGISPKLTSQWVGPCDVLEKLSDVVYRVRLIKRRRVVALHRDRLAQYRPQASAEGRGDFDTDSVELGDNGAVALTPVTVQPSPEVTAATAGRPQRQRRVPARLMD
ncbi:uncharacterized protein LOC121693610 [Alosa sapidissima]|uniref:uncharacterized protein LOC121693610 n=1 Tax=Alosa sapidissima TaxID=34773 RepID=UPI001C09BA10|nr:uncharacterized protein LOC121693610 [Alosa sapidissima]